MALRDLLRAFFVIDSCPNIRLGPPPRRRGGLSSAALGKPMIVRGAASGAARDEETLCPCVD